VIRRRLLLLLAVAVMIPAAACNRGSSGGDAVEVAAVDAAIDAARHALAAGDVAGFMAVWTENGLQQVFYEAGEAFMANSGYYVGTKQYTLGESSTPTVMGDTATVVAPLFFRLVGAARQFTLRRFDGTWKIDAAALTTIDPRDATPVGVTFRDSTIRLDAADVADGNIALQVHNPSRSRHELNILTAPPEEDIASFFEHPEDAPPVPEGRSMPDGFDFVGGVVGIEPGTTVTVLFSKALPPARYVLFCNGEDGGSTGPHSRTGEFVELAIET
jgi:hypothetical protein